MDENLCNSFKYVVFVCFEGLGDFGRKVGAFEGLDLLS